MRGRLIRRTAAGWGVHQVEKPLGLQRVPSRESGVYCIQNLAFVQRTLRPGMRVGGDRIAFGFNAKDLFLCSQLTISDSQQLLHLFVSQQASVASLVEFSLQIVKVCPLLGIVGVE